eukprot:scaffold37881_cov69-Phaeocystis_antarctica.AAC.5
MCVHARDILHAKRVIHASSTITKRHAARRVLLRDSSAKLRVRLSSLSTLKTVVAGRRSFMRLSCTAARAQLHTSAARRPLALTGPAH